jgi:hypothetical protein
VWPFKRKPESPEEIAAEKKLDEVTRDVAWTEWDGEGPATPGLYFHPRVSGREPKDEHGLREAFRQGAEERREKLASEGSESPPE